MILEVLKESLGCSDNTARDALNGLVELNLFDKAKEGKEWVFALRPQKDIMQNWE